MDFKKAYLQVRVAPDLWKYQLVMWNGEVYVMTRLGFGLSISPKVMSRIVETIIKEEQTITASGYIDDVFIAESSCNAEDVVGIFRRFGLESKPIERIGLDKDVRVLGLNVQSNLQWRRDQELVTRELEKATRREVHGILGEWIGHVPVAGWLRVACAYIQRLKAKYKIGWDELVPKDIIEKVNEICQRLRMDGDPATGKWVVNCNNNVVIWTDASSIAMGVLLCISGDIVEDAAWLRKEDDTSHINMSELDAAIRGINLAITWGFHKFQMMTDSVWMAHGSIQEYTQPKNTYVI
jgi:hypothetical protein